MAFQVSPGVLVQERDISSVIPAVATTPAGIAGYFQWGPADQRILVDSENNLVQLFGAPDNDTYDYFFSAANFLNYGNNLQVVRVVHSSSKNAVAGPTSGDNSILIKNSDVYDNATSSGTVGYSGASATAHFAAKYAGSLGNSLKIDLCDGTGAFAAWNLSGQFSTSPGTSDFAAGYGGTYDEMHIAVIDEDGRFSGVTGTILEKFQGVSKASDARRPDGSSNYYANVLNNESRYVWWLNHPTGVNSHAAGLGGTYGTISNQGTAFALGASGGTGGATYSFLGGTASSPTADSDIAPSSGNTTGYGLFSDPDFVDVSLLICGPLDADASNNVANIARTRLDCVAFASPAVSNPVATSASKVTACETLRNTIGNNAYAFLDTGYKYQYDRYNDVYRWVPLNADIAGLCARTDLTNDPWWSPAGFNRGQIKGVIKLAFNPSAAERDNLYLKSINPVVTLPGEGTVLYGDKTAQTKASAFDRINVRRLFIVLEKSISVAAKYQLFEFNDAFTRAMFVSMVEPFLRDVQARRGVYDFKVICDESNNTSQVVDANRFVADIFIKPAKSINFIQLSFIATRTGVSFEEITSLNSPR